MAKENTHSAVAIDEFYASEDDRFLEAFRGMRGHQRLAAFADRWKRDPRPWARQQIFAYLDLPMDCRDHQPVVKRLFKHAEESKDDALMGAFLRAFDRLVQPKRVTRWRYDWQTRQSWQEESLHRPRNTVPLKDHVLYTDWQGRQHKWPVKVPKGARLFSYRTRYYLRRRAWRYFRHMGYQRPDDYTAAVADALAGYTDDDLNAGELILECWGLMHACFHHHNAVEHGATRFTVAEGRNLGDLTPAPRFPELWNQQAGCAALMRLLTDARSRMLRVWSIQMLRADHLERLSKLPPEELLKLLDHHDDEVQQFASELLEQLSGLETLPVSLWLRLLETENPIALSAICDLMGRHVSAERLELADCIALAKAEATPVARMGLEYLKQRRIASAEDREAICAVAEGQCEAIGRELAQWALGIVGRGEVYDVDVVVRFFDSLLLSVRQGAWDWLVSESDGQPTPGYHDAALWSRLIETPFDDVRMKLVDLLQQRAFAFQAAGRGDKVSAALPGAPNADLSAVWSAVLLGVHRGGRQKVKALRQISEAIRQAPGRADVLLPVLAVAIRSVRPGEAGHGLAALVGAVEAHPELAALVARHLPELDLSPAAKGGAG